MDPDFDVIIAGDYSVDLIFSGLPEFPQLGKDVIGSAFKKTPGEAFIGAVSMHRLGIRVGWAGDFGSDEFSLYALKCAQEEGLDSSLFARHNRPYRRISAAASFPADRGFITYYDPEPSVPAIIPALLKSSARVVLIPGLYTGKYLKTGKKLISSKNIALVMDGNSSSGDILGKDKHCKALKEAISCVDIFLPNAAEARRITGMPELQKAIYILAELCPVVVIKDGVNGSLACTKGEITHVPSIEVHPVDTTGAGDNFNAGFLRAWLDGLPIELCLRWGNVVGALSTTELGGTSRKITCELVKQYL